MTDITFHIIRKPEVLAKAGISSTSLFEQSKAGLFPPAIPLGARAVGYLKHEIQAVIAARAIGESDERIKEIVKSLIEQRKQAANSLLSQLAA